MCAYVRADVRESVYERGSRKKGTKLKIKLPRRLERLRETGGGYVDTDGVQIRIRIF